MCVCIYVCECIYVCVCVSLFLSRARDLILIAHSPHFPFTSNSNSARLKLSPAEIQVPHSLTFICPHAVQDLSNFNESLLFQLLLLLLLCDNTHSNWRASANWLGFPQKKKNYKPRNANTMRLSLCLLIPTDNWFNNSIISNIITMISAQCNHITYYV